MKNYIRDVIDRYINHDYPKEVEQDFRTWLTDEERADEKDHELNQLWEATESATTSGYRHSLERMRELTGIGTRRRIHSLRTHLVVWRVAAALLIFFRFYLSGFAEPAGTRFVASIYSYRRDAEHHFAGWYAGID